MFKQCNCHSDCQRYYILCILGPKKKGGGKKEIIESKHLLNIYKDKEDIEILPDEYYPKWLNEINRPLVVPEDLVYIYLRGEKVKRIIFYLF